MVLSAVTKKHIEEKLGRKIRYPSDYELLVNKIEQVTKRRISINTLKRLLGLIKCVNMPRLYTLDTIALFIGFENWDAYLMSLYQEYSSSSTQINRVTEVRSDNLNHGQKIKFQYYPDKVVEMEYLGNRQYRVADSRNSKLQVDDIVEVPGFFVGYPLVGQCLVREGVNMGRFMAGEVSGLTYLELM